MCPHRTSAMSALVLVNCDASHMFCRVGQFDVTVRQFKLPHEYLETVCNGLIRGTELRECRLAGEKVLQHRELVVVECWRDSLRQN